MTSAAPDRSAFFRHGGRRAAAQALYPDAPLPWVDLSTGVNPNAYPAPRASRQQRASLPDPEDVDALEATAARAFGVSPDRIVAVPGSEAAIRLLPRILKADTVAIAQPTYGGHAEAWALTGAQIVDSSAAAMVVVNPNNPDGRTVSPAGLAAAARAGAWVIADEAFAETDPSVSVAAEAGGRLVVLRSFGKFYGLPGLRLGFVLAEPSLVNSVREAFGDWPISADAIAAGRAAYADAAWADRTRAALSRAAARLDSILVGAGMTVIGGTSLFRLARSDDAQVRFDALARAGILCRPFADDPALLRFGLPGRPQAWRRLMDVLGGRHVH